MVVVNELLIRTGTGVLAGLGMGLLGYFRKPNVKFDWVKLVPVVVVAGITGGVAAYFEIEMGVAENMVVSMGIGVAVTNAVKAVYRHLTN